MRIRHRKGQQMCAEMSAVSTLVGDSCLTHLYLHFKPLLLSEEEIEFCFLLKDSISLKPLARQFIFFSQTGMPLSSGTKICSSFFLICVFIPGPNHVLLVILA